MRSIHALSLAITLAAATASCVIGPNTGTMVAADTQGYQVSFSGRSDTASTQVTTWVLADPNSDPVTGTYSWIGSTTTGSTPYYQYDSKAYFNWSLTSNPLTVNQFPPGGLVRLKARSKFNGNTSPNDMYTFDNEGYVCLLQNLGESWITAGGDCHSPYPLTSVITMVSTQPTPFENHGPELFYLNYRGGYVGPQQETVPNTKVTDYYTQINAPETLPLFQSKYGFGTAGSDEAHAIYYNAGDLGIGRDMHCKSWLTIKNVYGKACYVTNYGRQQAFPFKVTFGSLDPQVAISEAIAANQPVATVAMVYDPSFPLYGNTVQFMVFDKDGLLTPFAALDNYGVDAFAHPELPTNANINVPDNCLTCHGSSSQYTPVNGIASAIYGAQFLPFDAANMVFSSTSSTYSQANMIPQIKALNAHVYDTAVSAATTDLLNGMYGSSTGPKDPSAVANNTYVPSGWSSQGKAATQVYNEVVKPYCRTCHVSHNHDSRGLDWVNYTDFQTLSGYIKHLACDNGYGPMPQSKQTQDRFWNSPARAHLVNAFSLGGACAP